ncbi:MAG TPA: outer membrane beta-barrel protein [Sphingobacteriaceae bacterium]
MKQSPFKAVALFAAVLMFFAQSVLAQSKTTGGKIGGSVVDNNQKPLDYATIILMKAADSSITKTAFSDLSGKFTFENVAQGDYLVTASMVGYKKAVSKPITVNGNTADAGRLQLDQLSKTLKEVTVLAQKPFIERKMDKLVVNVENSSVSAGSTAMEVLEKAPGVTIDKDDNISMKGKQGVLIMLDGKPTHLSSADVANMLRNMQSNQIETIELITSPSARYDAAGTSGIINIKTRKSKNMGLNGTLTAGMGYGETSKYNGGTTLNYRKGRINAFGNYNYGNNGRINSLDLNREVTYEGTVTSFKQLNGWDNRRNSNSYKAGLDYFINSKHTIGVLVNGYSNSNDATSNSNTFRKNNLNESEDILVLGRSNETYSNMAYNLNYKGTFDSTGKELSVDVDYSDYQGRSDELRDNFYSVSNGTAKNPIFVKNFSPSDILVKSLKMDYTNPLSKTAKFEAGVKFSRVETDNNLVLAKLEGNNWTPDAEYTNHFLYTESINAAYLNYSKEFKKYGLQFGLRAEQTVSEGNSITKNEVVKRDYLELFPSVSLSHTINKSHQLGLSYSRRIDRPGYDDLNPFMHFLDEYTFRKGNPYLNPQFTNSFDLTHTFKGSFTTSLNYSHTKNVMTMVTEQDDATMKTYAIQRNLDEQQIFGLNLFAPIPVAKWWNINNNAQVFHMRFKSKTTGEELNSGQTAVTYNMDHSFTIDKTFTAEFSTQYQSPLQYGIFKIQSQLVNNIGLRKSFMGNKMNVRVGLNDIFDNRRHRLSTTYQNMNLNFVEKGESRVGRITLNYRFGKNEIKPSRRRNTGVEAEANRMKN